MFAKSIIDSDAFLDMPQSSQLLYFHLAMQADDDGFVNNPKSIMRNVRCNEDDLKELIAKGFVMPFESGVIVIRHWKIHNYIRKDMYKRTIFAKEWSTLYLDEQGVYQHRNEPVTNLLQHRNEIVTQDRVNKDSLNKDNLERELIVSHALYGIYQNVKLSEKELETLKTEFPSSYEQTIDNLSDYMKRTGKKYDSHFAAIRKWAKEDAKKAEQVQKSVKEQKTISFRETQKKLDLSDIYEF